MPRIGGAGAACGGIYHKKRHRSGRGSTQKAQKVCGGQTKYAADVMVYGVMDGMGEFAVETVAVPWKWRGHDSLWPE